MPDISKSRIPPQKIPTPYLTAVKESEAERIWGSTEFSGTPVRFVPHK